MSSMAGSFLVARPVLQDPNFRHAVVLILQHGGEGAFGLVVNRPASVKGLSFPLYTGGPCKSQGMLMLHGHAEWTDPSEKKNAVAPGVFLGDSDCLRQATESPPDGPLRFRVFNGYAGWGPGQLESELSSGAWAVTQASGPVLFDTPVQELWELLVPPKIPMPSLN